MSFDAEKVKNDIVEWIRDWFEINGKGCKAVIGISGGKDSSVVAALCVEALGKENVFGVLMPQNTQSDIDIAKDLCSYLGINWFIIDIGTVVNDLLDLISLRGNLNISKQSEINCPPRVRMTTLYAVAQSINGRVANTCNLSEDWVGYSTRYGDTAGDFSPLALLTVQEVKAIGRSLELPEKFIEKIPVDGLSGKTDEDNLGFSYEVLDRYIRTGICEDADIKAKIDELHERNKFKLNPMPVYYPI